jgi:hypothetical protein
LFHYEIVISHGQSIPLRLQAVQPVPVEPNQSVSRQIMVGFLLLWGTDNFQKFLEMLDGAQTGRDDTGNLVSS